MSISDFVTDWSWERPFVTGTVYVIENIDLRSWHPRERIADHMWSVLERGQARRWFFADTLIFESLDDAVAFRLSFNTQPIKERIVEAQAGS